MTFIDTVKACMKREEITEASKDFLEDLIGAVLGDPIAAGKALITITKLPFFIREQIFWTKMEAFLNGVFLNESDRLKLGEKLAKGGDKHEAALRLLDIIDKAETLKKIHFIINAARCLLGGLISRTEFFRICHLIVTTLEEDLTFLSMHIHEENLLYSDSVQGLLTSGLMYQSIFDGNGEQKYSFSAVAKLVDQYAVSFENSERYPIHNVYSHDGASPQMEIENVLTWNNVSDVSEEEIDDMFK